MKSINNSKVYFLVDKETGKITYGPMASREEARNLKIGFERIAQATVDFNKFVR